MKKITTLFHREYADHKVVGITSEVTPGLEWVLNGEGVATLKWDGSCCAIINGEFYKRYDAKVGKNGKYKTPPEGAIPCCDPDPITGHWPHWVKVSEDNPGDKWFVEAYMRFGRTNKYADGTYEAVGKHFQGNPYEMEFDTLIPHGIHMLDIHDRSFEGIKEYLRTTEIEGIVFWKDGEPKCKIKRSDFGFEWPVKNRVVEANE